MVSAGNLLVVGLIACGVVHSSVIRIKPTDEQHLDALKVTANVYKSLKLPNDGRIKPQVEAEEELCPCRNPFHEAPHKELPVTPAKPITPNKGTQREEEKETQKQTEENKLETPTVVIDPTVDLNHNKTTKPPTEQINTSSHEVTTMRSHNEIDLATDSPISFANDDLTGVASDHKESTENTKSLQSPDSTEEQTLSAGDSSPEVTKKQSSKENESGHDEIDLATDSPISSANEDLTGVVSDHKESTENTKSLQSPDSADEQTLSAGDSNTEVTKKQSPKENESSHDEIDLATDSPISFANDDLTGVVSDHKESTENTKSLQSPDSADEQTLSAGDSSPEVTKKQSSKENESSHDEIDLATDSPISFANDDLTGVASDHKESTENTKSLQSPDSADEQTLSAGDSSPEVTKKQSSKENESGHDEIDLATDSPISSANEDLTGEVSDHKESTENTKSLQSPDSADEQTLSAGDSNTEVTKKQSPKENESSHDEIDLATDSPISFANEDLTGVVSDHKESTENTKYLQSPDSADEQTLSAGDSSPEVTKKQSSKENESGHDEIDLATDSPISSANEDLTGEVSDHKEITENTKSLQAPDSVEEQMISAGDSNTEVTKKQSPKENESSHDEIDLATDSPISSANEDLTGVVSDHKESTENTKSLQSPDSADEQTLSAGDSNTEVTKKQSPKENESSHDEIDLATDSPISFANEDLTGVVSDHKESTENTKYLQSPDSADEQTLSAGDSSPEVTKKQSSKENESGHDEIDLATDSPISSANEDLTGEVSDNKESTENTKSLQAPDSVEEQMISAGDSNTEVTKKQSPKENESSHDEIDLATDSPISSANEDLTGEVSDHKESTENTKSLQSPDSADEQTLSAGDSNTEVTKKQSPKENESSHDEIDLATDSPISFANEDLTGVVSDHKESTENTKYLQSPDSADEQTLSAGDSSPEVTKKQSPKENESGHEEIDLATDSPISFADEDLTGVVSDHKESIENKKSSQVPESTEEEAIEIIKNQSSYDNESRHEEIDLAADSPARGVVSDHKESSENKKSVQGTESSEESSLSADDSIHEETTDNKKQKQDHSKEQKDHKNEGKGTTPHGDYDESAVKDSSNKRKPDQLTEKDSSTKHEHERSKDQKDHKNEGKGTTPHGDHDESAVKGSSNKRKPDHSAEKDSSTNHERDHLKDQKDHKNVEKGTTPHGDQDQSVVKDSSINNEHDHSKDHKDHENVGKGKTPHVDHDDLVEKDKHKPDQSTEKDSHTKHNHDHSKDLKDHKIVEKGNTPHGDQDKSAEKDSHTKHNHDHSKDLKDHKIVEKGNTPHGDQDKSAEKDSLTKHNHDHSKDQKDHKIVEKGNTPHGDQDKSAEKDSHTKHNHDHSKDLKDHKIVEKGNAPHGDQDKSAEKDRHTKHNHDHSKDLKDHKIVEKGNTPHGDQDKSAEKDSHTKHNHDNSKDLKDHKIVEKGNAPHGDQDKSAEKDRHTKHNHDHSKDLKDHKIVEKGNTPHGDQDKSAEKDSHTKHNHDHSKDLKDHKIVEKGNTPHGDQDKSAEKDSHTKHNHDHSKDLKDHKIVEKGNTPHGDQDKSAEKDSHTKHNHDHSKDLKDHKIVEKGNTPHGDNDESAETDSNNKHIRHPSKDQKDHKNLEKFNNPHGDQSESAEKENSNKHKFGPSKDQEDKNNHSKEEKDGEQLDVKRGNHHNSRDDKVKKDESPFQKESKDQNGKGDEMCDSTLNYATVAGMVHDGIPSDKIVQYLLSSWKK